MHGRTLRCWCLDQSSPGFFLLSTSAGLFVSQWCTSFRSRTWNINCQNCPLSDTLPNGTFAMVICSAHFLFPRRSVNLSSLLDIVTRKCVPHGTTSAIMCLQSTLGALLPVSPRPFVIYWLKDIRIYTSSNADHFTVVSVFFAFCGEYNLKLHPPYCTVFVTSILWYRRVISPDDVSVDPGSIYCFFNMFAPQTGADL